MLGVMWRPLLATFMALLAAAPAGAAPSYLGRWIVVSSSVAPWVAGAAEPPNAAATRLTGSRIVFRRHAIAAPPPLACAHPRYRVRTYSADMLFQGNLPSPRADAARLGFATPAATTLETSCEDGPEFHFVDARTALFALDNRIFRMVR
jgi:hypothetical protein